MFKLVVVSLLFAAAWAAPTKTKDFISKIVGGSEVTPGELPYQISLQDISWGLDWHFCGGAVIGDSWVATASHCVQGASVHSLQIVAGEHDLDRSEGHEQKRRVTKIITHERFDNWLIQNDIALLKLAEPLTQNNYVKAIPLSPEGHSASGSCTVSGWGALSEGGNSPSKLRKVNVPIISDSKCRQQYGNQIVETMLCAGYSGGGKDACQGDSGGPLACHDQGQYLAGVVSWGYGCARPNQAGVYTEISYFRDWIQKKIAAN